MIRIYLRIILLGIFFSCATARITSSSGDDDLLIAINEGEKTKLAETIIFNITNINNESITIYNPRKLFIEKETGGLWKKVRILDCPCDAPCQAPIKEEILLSQSQIKLIWDQQESWCGPKTQEQIRKSIYQFVDKGEYRIRIDYKPTTGKRTSVYKTFRIF